MPAHSTSAKPAALGASWWHTLRDIVGEPAFIYGVKFGISGVVAVFLALVLRLQEPTWALFTVFVLMIAQYVGAIGEKSFFRVVGTIVGGLLGYVLTAAFEQNALIYLICIGLIVGICTAMFGQSRYPYAFLLCGLTVVVVSSNGMADPDNSWQYMLWRVEEVCIGVVATVLVQCLFWPRYARKEFIENVRAAFADLRECLVVSGDVFLKDADATKAVAKATEFPARISGLRGLLDFGARESQFFRARLSTYFEITVCLSRIASAIVTLGEKLPKASVYREVLGDSVNKLHCELEDALENLSQTLCTTATRNIHRKRVDDAFEDLEARFSHLRSNPRYFDITPEEAMILGTHVVALDDIRREITRAHELLDSLPEDPTDNGLPPENAFVAPVPTRFWMRTGVKSGIAVVLALFLENWLRPPGGTMFVLGAWVFTAMNASSPGGQGDRRTFHYIAYNVLFLIGFCLLLLFLTPVLSSYAAMNIFLFTWLFVWGYLSYQTRGMTIPMQMGMLLAVGLLGLNGQRPVHFQDIAQLFFGIAFGQVLAALVQRLIWPSLPQRELRNRFVEYLRLCQQLIKEGPPSLAIWQRARLALIPGEAIQRIRILNAPICPEGEQQYLLDYLHSLQRVGGHLVVTIGRLVPALPVEHTERGRELSSRLEAALAEHLAAHERSMARTEPLQTVDDHLNNLLDDLRKWVAEVRNWMRENDHPVLESVRILGLTGRYEQAGQDLIIATDRARRLRMPLYMGDYVL